MNTYQVGIKIYNSFDVEAETEEDAERIIRELDCFKVLDDCDFNITYVEKESEE